MGEASPYLCYRNKTVPKITKTSSFTQKNSTSIMGWKVTNAGLEVIFSKSIPALVKTLWKDHISTFLQDVQIEEQQLHSLIAHPEIGRASCRERVWISVGLSRRNCRRRS